MTGRDRSKVTSLRSMPHAVGRRYGPLSRVCNRIAGLPLELERRHQIPVRFLNLVYNEEEKRGLIKLNLVSLLHFGIKLCADQDDDRR
jgi:hypothetical protein